jgi:DNA-binding NtrC family response regulator
MEMFASEPRKGSQMSSHRILVVDDESSLRTALFRVLDRKGYQVVTASTRLEAEKFANGEQTLDLALIDLRLPDGDGIDLMATLKRVHPNLQSIILTGFGTIETAVKATQKGAFHFLTKPFNIDEVVSLVEKALSHNSQVSASPKIPFRQHHRPKSRNHTGARTHRTCFGF